MKVSKIFTAAFAAAIASNPGDVTAYYVDQAGSHNCHERLAMESLRSAGYPSAPPEPSKADLALFDAVEFDASIVDGNIYALSLVIGTRSVDVGDASWMSLSEIIGFHNDPDVQAIHCLRLRGQDFQKGDAEAVESCRKAILHEVGLALAGSDAPDFAARETVPFYIQYAGSRKVSLSRFYYRLGRALHAVHDGFAHTYRTADRTGIVAVGNWIEYVAGDMDVERDGPPHDSIADECDNSRAWNAPTVAAAVQSGAEFIGAVSGAFDGKAGEAALAAFFEKWFGHVPDCSAANGWCGSPDPGDLKAAGAGGIGCSIVSLGVD